MKHNFGPFASHQATLSDLMILLQVKFGPASIKKLYFGPISSIPGKSESFFLSIKSQVRRFP